MMNFDVRVAKGTNIFTTIVSLGFEQKAFICSGFDKFYEVVHTNIIVLPRYVTKSDVEEGKYLYLFNYRKRKKFTDFLVLRKKQPTEIVKLSEKIGGTSFKFEEMDAKDKDDDINKIFKQSLINLKEGFSSA